MGTKDYILIFISGSALFISIISLIITLVQKYRETQRTIRKNLSDTLEAITKISIETSKLRASKEIDNNSEAIIGLRRTYNSQRRTLVAHADFLVSRYERLTTEIDYNVLAIAYAAIGDHEKAENFWRRCIEKSISKPIKHMNLRGLGIHLFNNGKINEGRKCFDEASAIVLPDGDDYHVIQVDTYLMLCSLEKEFGDKINYDTSLTNAMEVLGLIKSNRCKEEMHERLRLYLPGER